MGCLGGGKRADRRASKMDQATISKWERHETSCQSACLTPRTSDEQEWESPSASLIEQDPEVVPDVDIASQVGVTIRASSIQTLPCYP